MRPIWQHQSRICTGAVIGGRNLMREALKADGVADTIDKLVASLLN
jgi:hypothetical protein